MQEQLPRVLSVPFPLRVLFAGQPKRHPVTVQRQLQRLLEATAPYTAHLTNISWTLVFTRIMLRWQYLADEIWSDE